MGHSSGKKITLIFLLAFASLVCVRAQYSITPLPIATLPAVLNESSGLAIIDSTNIWSHNDSGDSAFIYNIHPDGSYVRIIKLKGVNAKDFEDITRDSIGNMYIGDFGNNLNTRQDLCIYKIPGPETFSGDSIYPQKISFSYPDQHAFPPPDSLKNFDCEAMFHYNRTLFLFSKNRGTSHFVKMYQIPDSAGTYIASLVDSFYIDSGWVTAADISPDKKQMVLLNEAKLHVFRNFQGTDFFGGDYLNFKFTDALTQKEGIVFISNHALYLSDEVFIGTGGKLYYLDLNKVMGMPEVGAPDLQIYPNPFTEKICIRSNAKYDLLVININGEVVYKAKDRNESTIINTSSWPCGVYCVKTNLFSKNIIRKMIKLN